MWRGKGGEVHSLTRLKFLGLIIVVGFGILMSLLVCQNFKYFLTTTVRYQSVARISSKVSRGRGDASMVLLRKPSSIHYNNSLQASKPSIESRFRSILTKRGIIYGCTALIVLLLLSLIITGIPDGTNVSSNWSSNIDELPHNPIPSTLPAITDVIHDPDFDSSKNPETHIPPTYSSALQDAKLSKDGLPLISTQNNGRIVLLTGATGPGNFEKVEGFYSKVVSNRLDYAKAHGTAFP
jgi:hypothetical protein